MKKNMIKVLGLGLIAAIILGGPLFYLLNELCYMAYPSPTHEPWDSLTSDDILFGCVLGLFTLVQEILVAKWPFFHKRNLQAGAAVLGFSLLLSLLFSLSLIFSAELDSPRSYRVAAIFVEGMFFVFLWITPCIAYSYLVRSAMIRLKAFAASAVLYLAALIVMLPIAFVCAKKLGEHDGMGQAIVALLACLVMVSIASGGLADLFYRNRLSKAEDM